MSGTKSQVVIVISAKMKVTGTKWKSRYPALSSQFGTPLKAPPLPQLQRRLWDWLRPLLQMNYSLTLPSAQFCFPPPLSC